MARCYRIHTPFGQLRNVNKISTKTFVITRHTCHRSIYLLVTIIFANFTCTITSFIKTYLLLPFIIIFWWIQKFYKYVIFRSTSKAFLRLPLCLAVVWMTSCTELFLFLCDPFETFFAEWLTPQQKMPFVWKILAFSLFLPNPEFFSIFK